MTRVSDQVSTGPKGVPSHSNARIRSAISPVPIMREGEASLSGEVAVLLREWRREDDMREFI